jgi:hypothetical protein
MRRTERIPVDIPVVWTRAGRAISLKAVDINAHGMFLRTEQVVEPESLMHLRVHVRERPLEMFVTARFVGKTASGQGIGVEIFLIDDVSQVQWVSFYERTLAEYANARKSVALGS